LAGDSESQRLAEALTGELPGPLARSDIAIQVMPAARGPTGMSDFRGVARELNVRYVLEGSVQSRRGEGETRLILVDGASGAQVWSETIVLPLNGSGAERKHAVRTAMEHLRNRLINVEARRASALPEGAGSPVEEVLRADAMSQGDKTLDVLRRQEAVLERALRKDPNSVPVLLALAVNLDGQLDIDSHVDRDQLMGRMDEITTRAVNLNPAWPDTWAQRASALMSLGRWEAALEAIDKAIAVDPEAAWLVKTKAHMTLLAGRPQEALALVAKAASMDPEEGGRGMRIACEAHLLLGRYAESVADCERALGRGFDEFDVAYFLAPAYAHIGDGRAGAEAAKILRRSPGFTIGVLKAKKYSVQPDYLNMAEEHWYTGLRKAGIPEK